LRIIWNDPAIGIDWPVKAPLLSDKDRIARTLAEQIDLMPVWREELA
jgi:dTDP-4-dehydrorhamnose 3,5-epimerase